MSEAAKAIAREIVAGPLFNAYDEHIDPAEVAAATDDGGFVTDLWSHEWRLIARLVMAVLDD